MRAIILAAGMGTRLRPLTLEIPKPLIKIEMESLIERQIKMLKNIGIEEIIIVTGYLNEKFNFLKEKYDVKLINNDKYDIYNNIYTMYLVKDYLEDAYVIEGDIYINGNFLTTNIKQSTYFSAMKYDYNNEWILRYNENDIVTDIEVGNEYGAYIMSGISYWNAQDAKFIKDKLLNYIDSGEFDELFWDDIIKDNIKSLNIKIKKLKTDDIYEIDSLKDLKEINEKLR